MSHGFASENIKYYIIIYLFTYLFVYLLVYLFIYLFIYLFYKQIQYSLLSLPSISTIS